MVRVEDPAKFYESLRREAKKSSSNTVHIFTAAIYADSIVSLKLLTDLLRSDSIKYSVFPVYGYGDIESHAKKGMTDKKEPYVGIFVNCGATINLLERFDVGQKTKFFILDCHRPFHLKNLSTSNRQVVIAWTREDELKADTDLMRSVDEGVESDSDADEDEDSEDDYESGREEFGDRRKRRKTLDPVQRAARRDQRRIKLSYYTRGTYYGAPTGHFLYNMAHKLHRDTNEHLWFACIAITDHLIHKRSSPDSYAQLSMELETQCSNLTDQRAFSDMGEGVSVRVPDMNRVHCSEELHLVCLPRWNLYESLKYSTLTCTRLQTWSVPGEKKLKLLLAELGISLEKARQKWPYMDPKIQGRLKADMESKSKAYSLEKFSYKSFRLHHGYKFKVTSADMVYCMTALLESGRSQAERADHFWTASGTLAPNGMKNMDEGMDLAIKVQRAIVRQGSLILAKKSLAMGAGKKYCQTVLEDLTDADVLAHPLALTRLAHFLMAAQDAVKTKVRPIVIAALVEEQHPKTMAFIVGVTPPHLLEEYSTGNKFGLSFNEAAERLGVGVESRHDMFESSYFEIEQVYVQKFLTHLEEVIKSDS